jgi:Bacterial aa3 type cytochrome c oxidase subunit IV
MADQNMKTANETYNAFLGWTKWGIIISAAITVLVVLLIA